MTGELSIVKKKDDMEQNKKKGKIKATRVLNSKR